MRQMQSTLEMLLPRLKPVPSSSLEAAFAAAARQKTQARQPSTEPFLKQQAFAKSPQRQPPSGLHLQPKTPNTSRYQFQKLLPRSFNFSGFSKWCISRGGIFTTKIFGSFWFHFQKRT